MIRIAKMSDDVNILALVKGSERYIWMYDDSQRGDVICRLARFADDPALSFTWWDAKVLCERVRAGCK